MATTILPSSDIFPRPDNFYLVNFEDTIGCEKIGNKNPLDAALMLSQWVKPFIPHNNSDRVRQFEKDTIAIRYNYEIFNIDPIKHSLASLTIRDLLNLSEASKSLYLAVRSNTIWEIKLKQLLPNTSYLKGSLLNPEQQFQIVFQKISRMKKPYVLMLKQYENSLHDFDKKLVDTELQKPGCFTEAELESELTRLVGENYKGSPESIASDSKIGRCMMACILIPNELNNQDKFVEVIGASEKIYHWENPNR